MKRYAIIAGLCGGYNSVQYREVKHFENELSAVKYAEELALEEADDYGIYDDAYSEALDDGEDEDSADAIAEEEVQSWISYQVIEVPEEMTFDEMSGEDYDDIAKRIETGNLKYDG